MSYDGKDDIDYRNEAKRQLRLEFIKAAMQGMANNYLPKDYDLTARFAVQLADATLAAAGEK